MRYEPEQLNRLIAAVERQAVATEGQTEAIERLVQSISEHMKKPGLGESTEPLYPGPANRLVTERAMAEALSVSPRTLGNYRRQHRLPGCWIRNGRRVLWRYQETLELWMEGIQ